MLFGLINALATCQELINNVLRAHLNNIVVAYLDNILVYLKTLEEHIKHVTEVLECLKQADLQLKPKKCKQHKEEVKFLGFIVGRNRVKISLTKIKVIKLQQTPIIFKNRLANRYRLGRGTVHNVMYLYPTPTTT